MSHIRTMRPVLVTLALLGLAAAPAAHAQTTLFSDNFGTNAQTNVTNGTTDTGRIGGTLYDSGTFAYVDNTGDTVGSIITATPGPVISGGTLVIGPSNPSANAGYSSPNFSFGTGNTVTISFDMLAGTTDGSALPSDGNWTGLFFGSSTDVNIAHSNVNKVDGFGLIFRNNGLYNMFDNTVQAAPTGTWGTAGAVTHVAITLDDTVVTAPTFSVFINNSVTPLFSYTRTSGTALGGDFIGLTTSNTTAVEQFGFDNFAVTTPAAAPEPSQTAAFGLGVLGLACLAFKARRRASVTG